MGQSEGRSEEGGELASHESTEQGTEVRASLALLDWNHTSLWKLFRFGAFWMCLVLRLEFREFLLLVGCQISLI